jgi:hypothetical protein
MLSVVHQENAAVDLTRTGRHGRTPPLTERQRSDHLREGSYAQNRECSRAVTGNSATGGMTCLP